VFPDATPIPALAGGLAVAGVSCGSDTSRAIEHDVLYLSGDSACAFGGGCGGIAIISPPATKQAPVFGGILPTPQFQHILCWRMAWGAASAWVPFLREEARGGVSVPGIDIIGK